MGEADPPHPAPEVVYRNVGVGWGALLAAFVLGATAVVGLFWTWKWERNLLEALRRSAALTPGDSPSTLRRFFGGDLPGWLSSPDVGRGTWINQVTEALWPHVREAGATWALDEAGLGAMLRETTFWRPKWLSGMGIKVLAFELGNVTPIVNGVHVHSMRPGDDRVVMDFEFSWRSKMFTKLQISASTSRPPQAAAEMAVAVEGEGELGGDGTPPGVEGGAPKSAVVSEVAETKSSRFTSIGDLMGAIGRKAKIGVSVHDLVATGTIRAELRPLLGVIPVVGAVKVSMLRAPRFSYRVSSLGVNPMFLPGLEAFIASFISRTVLAPLTYPEGIEVPLPPQTGGNMPRPADELPDGILTVTVIRARRLPRMDVLGWADPYVRLSVRDKDTYQTSVKAFKRNPVWNETFYMTVIDPDVQALSLTLFDSDALVSDDEIGRLEVPLRPIAEAISAGAGDVAAAAAATAGPGGDGRGGGGGGGGGGNGEARVRDAREGGDESGRLGRSRAAAADDTPFAKVQGPESSEDRNGGRGLDTAIDPTTSSVAAIAKSGVNVWLEFPVTKAAKGPAALARDRKASEAASKALEAAIRETAASENEGRGSTTRSGFLGRRVFGSRKDGPPTSGGDGAGAVFAQGTREAGEGLAEALGISAQGSVWVQLRLSYTKFDPVELQAAVGSASAGEGTLEDSRAVGDRGARVGGDPRDGGLAHRVFNGGVLHVGLQRARDLVVFSLEGMTSQMRVRMRLGNQTRETEANGLRMVSKSDPVLNQSVEFVVTSDAVNRGDLVLELEILRRRPFRKPFFKGRVRVPLQNIIRRGRIQDTFPMEDVEHGEITMELTWRGAMDRYMSGARR